MRAITIGSAKHSPAGRSESARERSTLSNRAGRLFGRPRFRRRQRELREDRDGDADRGPDTASAGALAERLTLALGAERISFLGDRQEVGVRVERGSDRAILHVLDAVERWLEHASVGSAEMWLGDHSYRLARWVPVETWQ